LRPAAIPGWSLLFRLGLLAAFADIALLTTVAAGPLPLSANPAWLTYVAVVVGIAVAGLILRRMDRLRLAARIVAVELLPLAFWCVLFIGMSNGIDVLERLSPTSPSVAAPRPTD
jgi:hypothetical protein